MKPAFLAAVALLATAPLSLASVNLSISGDLSASTAPVSNPFNGAHFTLDALFPDGTYQD
ncbi:MAG: hypothetical protein JWO82_3134, partial [Akkermansiaceae bacterium]|nr:hypothetical protein [Akkermansiaceae bacterium]